MGRSLKQKYYAVAVGRRVGIFDTWEKCEEQVSGFPHARFKSFPTEAEAQVFIDENKGSDNTRVVLLPSLVNQSVADHVRATCTRTCREDLLPLLMRKQAEKRSREESNDANNNEKYSNDNNSNSEVVVPPLRGNRLSTEWMQALEKEAVEVYVDGSCRGNGKTEPGRARGGYGGYYVPTTTNRVSGNGGSETILCDFSLPLPDNEPQTNNRAELYAVIHVLQTALQAQRCYNLRVYSDSTYVIRGADIYMPLWLKRGFVTVGGSPVLNGDLWRRLQALRRQHEERYAARLAMEFNLAHPIALTASRRLALRFEHVRGHTGVYGNVMADRLAVNGALRGLRL